MNLKDYRDMLTEYTDLLYASPDGFAYSNPSDANGETHVTWSDGDGYPFIYLSHPLEFSPWFYARSVPDEKKFEYDDSQRFVVKSGLHVGDINERHADLYVGIILEYFHWLKDCGYMTQDDIDEETAGNYFEEDYIYDMGLDDLRDYNDAVVGRYWPDLNVVSFWDNEERTPYLEYLSLIAVCKHFSTDIRSIKVAFGTTLGTFSEYEEVKETGRLAGDADALAKHLNMDKRDYADMRVGLGKNNRKEAELLRNNYGREYYRKDTPMARYNSEWKRAYREGRERKPILEYMADPKGHAMADEIDMDLDGHTLFLNYRSKGAVPFIYYAEPHYLYASLLMGDYTNSFYGDHYTIPPGLMTGDYGMMHIDACWDIVEDFARWGRENGYIESQEDEDRLFDDWMLNTVAPHIIDTSDYVLYGYIWSGRYFTNENIIVFWRGNEIPLDIAYEISKELCSKYGNPLSGLKVAFSNGDGYDVTGAYLASWSEYVEFRKTGNVADDTEDRAMHLASNKRDFQTGKDWLKAKEESTAEKLKDAYPGESDPPEAQYNSQWKHAYRENREYRTQKHKLI